MSLKINSPKGSHSLAALVDVHQGPRLSISGSPLWLYLALLSLLLALCLPRWPAFSSSDAANSFLPQDLCTYCLE